jgi:hypothetical protein
MLRKILFNWYVVVIPVVITMFVVSCKNDQDVAPPELTGEEMFKGIYFFQGTAMNRLETLKPEYEKVEASLERNGMRAEYNDFMDQIMTQIKLLDPQYFDNFKSQLTSDNHYAIELAISNGWKMHTAAGYRTEYAEAFKLAEEIKRKNVDFTSDKIRNLDFNKEEDIEMFKNILASDYSIKVAESETGAQAGRGKCFAITFFVAGNFAVAVNVAMAWNAAYYQNWAWNEHFGANPNDALESETLISEIADKF